MLATKTPVEPPQRVRRPRYGLSFGCLEQLSACTLGDPALQLGAEVPYQALDRPRCGIAQRANGVPFNLLGDIEQLVDVLDLSVTLTKTLHHPPHPAGTLTAWRALPTALMLVEVT